MANDVKPNVSFSASKNSLTVVVDGKVHSVRSKDPHFEKLKLCLLKGDFEGALKNLTSGKVIQDWSNGSFRIKDKKVLYNDVEIPDSMSERIFDMVKSGEDSTVVLNFWKNLKNNPSFRSVNQLWGFLESGGIPLTPDGCFLAYKSVKDDFTDVHTGTYDNSPGAVHSMERNKISDDPEVACHYGFHVGSLDYASSFHKGGNLVICKVNPADVVCVPKDHNQGKMRVCKYTVIGHYTNKLPSTSFDDSLHFNSKASTPKPASENDNSDNGSTKANSPKTDKKAGKSGKSAPSKVVTANKKSSEYSSFNGLDMKGLLLKSIEELRKYAGVELDIVGASKIPGGKTALISAILSVRRKMKMAGK